MSLHLPEFIDEIIDYSSDPLLILLAREGEHEEAYQTARQYTAGARQIVERGLIEQREDDPEFAREKRLRRVKRSTCH